ncbi:MAG: helix-turn-helix domain-containing protein [Syntrophales bacterium]
MGRTAHFNNEQFVDAALRIAAQQGPAAMTIAAVAREVGAPIGSVYHRFLSRDILLAEVWLKVVSSFQATFLEALKKGRGLDAALHTPRWVRKYPAEARILLLYRREELTEGVWQDELKERVLRIKCALDDGVNDYVKRAFGKAGRKEIDRTVYALIDVPYAAVIRYIRQGVKPPRNVDDYIRQTYSAIMGRDK